MAPGEAGEGSQHLRDDQDELDERGIGMAVAEVVGLPMCAFTSRMRAINLAPRDEAFVKSLRRRIKNRMASQNSRRRNMEHLRSLSDELRAVRACKRSILEERAALTEQRASVCARLRTLYAHVCEKLKELGESMDLPFQLDLAPTTTHHINQVFQTNPVSPKLQPQSVDVNICNIKKEIFECSIENLVKQSVNHMFKFDKRKTVDKPYKKEMYHKKIIGVRKNKNGRSKNVSSAKNLKRKTTETVAGKNLASDSAENLVKEERSRLNESKNLAADLFAQNLVKSIVSDAKLSKHNDITVRHATEIKRSVVNNSLNDTDTLVAQICRANNLIIQPYRKKYLETEANTNKVTEKDKKRETFDAKIRKLKNSEAEFIRNIELLKEMPSGDKKMVRAKCVTVIRDDSLIENSFNRVKVQVKRNGCIKHTSQLQKQLVEEDKSATNEGFPHVEMARYCNVFLTNGGGVSVRAEGSEGCVLNLSVKENGVQCGERRKHHGRKQAAPRRITHALPEPEECVLDLKIKKQEEFE